MSNNLAHLYEPWCWNPVGPQPPYGSTAVCGHVFQGRPGRIVSGEHPDACVMCTLLIREHGERELEELLGETIS